jgi:lipopolysaccharide exporter
MFLKKQKFLKNIAILMSGTAIAQGLSIATAPILSRLYEPSDFGVFSLYISTLTIISVIITWKYELAIVLPREDEEAANILALSGLIIVFMTILSSFLVFFFGDFISLVLGSSELKPMLWWLPANIFILGCFQCLNYWSTRKQEFRRLSWSRIIKSLGVVSVQTSGGLTNKSSSWLIGGQLFGELIGCLTLGVQVWWKERKLIKNSISLEKIKKIAKKYNDFPKYNAPQALLNAISQNVVPFLLSYYFDPEVVGLYAITVKVLQLPIGLIGDSVRQVFFQKASEIYNVNKEGVYYLFKKNTLFLFFVGILPTVVLIFLGPSLFSFVLGDNWYKSGIYAQLIIPWLFIAFVNPPSVMMIPILNLQKQYLYFEIIFTITRIMSIIIGAYIGNDFIAIGLYSLVGMFFNFLLVAYIFIQTYRLNKSTINAQIQTKELKK